MRISTALKSETAAATVAAFKKEMMAIYPSFVGVMGPKRGHQSER
jgi:hypothetical protein